MEVWLLTPQKPIARQVLWKGKFTLFQMLATEVGERADSSPKADTPHWQPVGKSFYRQRGLHADRVSSDSLLEVGHVVIVLSTISLQFPEKAMAPYSSTFAFEIPWTEEPARLQSMGSLSRTWLSDFTFTFHFHALEKEMATHSSVLAWRIPGTGEPGGLPSMGSHRVGHDWSDLAATDL